MLERIKEIAAEDLGADSLDLFEMVMTLEEEFNVEIPSEDLEQIQTIGDVEIYIRKRQNPADISEKQQRWFLFLRWRTP